MRRTLTFLIGLALVLWFCWWTLGIAFAQACGPCGMPDDDVGPGPYGQPTLPAEVGTAVTEHVDEAGCLVTTTDGIVTNRSCPTIAYPIDSPHDEPVRAAPEFTG